MLDVIEGLGMRLVHTTLKRCSENTDSTPVCVYVFACLLVTTYCKIETSPFSY